MYKAEVITIGDELLSGSVDTNSSELDRCLEGAGYDVIQHTTVGDDEAAIARTFLASAQRADLVISTGGLGPTADDLTMAGLAEALGVRLVEDEAVLRSIEALFSRFGKAMTPNNARQALVPEGTEVIENRAGTAPAVRTTLLGADVFVLPGVPREVRFLLKEEILPRIQKERRVQRRTLKVVGIGESRLEHMIQDVVAAHPEVVFGYRTLGMENHLRLVAKGAGSSAVLDRVEETLRSVLEDRLYGRDDDTLASVVQAELQRRGLTVAVAESCTGGLLAKMLTDAPGSSGCFRGGIVAYANEIKEAVLGVEAEVLAAHGAVSEPVARQMASLVRDRFGASVGVSATGIAGPGGGLPSKPVGTVWVAVADCLGVRTRLLSLKGHRDWIRMEASKWALEELRRAQSAWGSRGA